MKIENITEFDIAVAELGTLNEIPDDDKSQQQMNRLVEVYKAILEFQPDFEYEINTFEG